MPRRGENIYKRKDGRWEGRYIKGYDENNKAKYASVYARTYSDVKTKLFQAKSHIPKNEKESNKDEQTLMFYAMKWLDKIKQSGLGGLSGRGYIIQEVTPHKFCTLQNYNLFNLQTSEIVIGSYDTMCEYIDGLVQDKQKTEAN